MASGKGHFDFVQVDVFTNRPLEGNPLAVFTDARGLSDALMQALAREMNLSETTFVLPADAETERRRGVRVRIFTPEEELPFAGHPTLGTAWVLRAAAGAQATAEVRLDLKVGAIPVTFSEDEDGGLFGEMRQVDPQFGQTHAPEAIAPLAGIAVEEFAAGLPIQTVSTGVPFAIAAVRSLEAIRRLRFDLGRAEEYAAKSDVHFFYFFTRETEDPQARIHSRMIFSNGEDPATGSAAGCAAAYMVRHGIASADERVMIEQGIEIRRPSRIFVRAGREGDRPVNVRVGGNVVEVLRGTVEISKLYS